MGQTCCSTGNASTAALRLGLLVGLLSMLAADVRGGESSQSRRGSDDPQVHAINSQIQQGWEEQKLTPSRRATDAEWARRLYLDVIGRIPSVEEITAFLGDRSPDKRRALVNRLLGDEYVEEYARHWATLWTNTLIGRTGGTTRESLADRSGMQQYLRRSFAREKPYDRMVYELITATGSCRPGDEDFNGAANFLADKLAENGVQATAKTAQIFLGTAVQCTQCHNHPFNEYKQNQFWELNAFYRQTRIQRLDTGERRRQVARIVDRDFVGEGRSAAWAGGDEIVWEQIDGELVDASAQERYAAPIYYELRNGKVKVAYPVFIDGTSLAETHEDRDDRFGNSGYLEHVNRREELAKLVLDAAELDRAIVNRMWGHFLGYGFTRPADDMGPHNPPSHPELLDELAKAFRAASYDFKELIRWIALSEPYALSSRTNRRNRQDDPSLGNQPMYSRFYLRQMQAEQLYESLLVATEAAETLGYDERQRVKQRWLGQFNTAFGTDENDEATSFNGSIPQVLMLMNGELVKKATSAGQGSFLDKIAVDAEMSNAEKVRYLYLAGLSRRPSREELALCNELLAARGGNVVYALQDIWWALLNSNEFILIH